MTANRQTTSNSIANTEAEALQNVVDSLADRLKSLSLEAKDTGEAVPGGAEAGEEVPGEAVPGEAVPDEAVPGEAVLVEAEPGEAVAGEAVGSAVDGSVVDVEAGVKDV